MNHMGVPAHEVKNNLSLGHPRKIDPEQSEVPPYLGEDAHAYHSTRFTVPIVDPSVPIVDPCRSNCLLNKQLRRTRSATLYRGISRRGRYDRCRWIHNRDERAGNRRRVHTWQHSRHRWRARNRWHAGHGRVRRQQHDGFGRNHDHRRDSYSRWHDHRS
jgi:hypothetical protein